MSPRFAYFYFMADQPEPIRTAVPAHVEHWRSLPLERYCGGPFTDHSGGLITFDAVDRRQAQRAVDTDPFVRKGLLDAHWLKQWQPHGSPAKAEAG